MQKFTTTAPIATVLDIPAGRVRFVASLREDTVVQVLPADPAKSRDVKAASQASVSFDDGVLRISLEAENQYFGPSGSVDVTVSLPAGSSVEAKSASRLSSAEMPKPFQSNFVNPPALAPRLPEDT